MRALFILFIWYMLSPLGNTQVDSTRLVTEGYFASPVDHTIKLAGSFGELRSNHFHAGIDIKSSNGREGDTIRSAADGYISRIKLQRGSYGKVLYIDHPNGYTSVYAHMQRFAPVIEDFIRQKQIDAQSYEMDVYLSDTTLTVQQGQPIGHLGNTGRSYGPHLHFEIRHTLSETPQNPYLHGVGPEDSTPPLLYAIGVEGLDSDLFPIYKDVRYISKGKGSAYGPHHEFEVPAWRAGLMIQTFDLMDGATNKNGIYHLKMYVDDSLHYELKLDSMPWNQTRYINSCIDYMEKKVNNRSLIRCFKNRGSRLSAYGTLKNNGYFKVYKSKPRAIRFEVEDFVGNTSTYTCSVRRKESAPPTSHETYQVKLRYDSTYQLKLGQTLVDIPKGTVDNVTLFSYEEHMNQDGYRIKLGDKSKPIFKRIKVNLPLHNIPTDLHRKAVMVYTDSKTPISYGGEVDSTRLISFVDKLGQYSVMVDTIPPSITPLEYKKTVGSMERFIFRLEDNFDTRGKAKDVLYSVYINDVWQICPLKALGNLLTIPLESVTEGAHTLKIIATDHSNNTRVWEGSFMK